MWALILALVILMSVLWTAACMAKFPGTSRGMIGAAINGKLTELRLKSKKVHGNVYTVVCIHSRTVC